jgi:asparagine synthase (glutamine-hydrolysing)
VCGICGSINYRTQAPVDESAVRAMAGAMIHRGPDDDGFHGDREAALGMRRLSIIDVAGGAQPIANEDRSIWVVSNGEIYNFRELRRELEAHDHVFATRSDTEVIVHAYEQWGFDGFARLNGMFGTALWDAKERQLVIARDPFGVKPLYYWDDGSALVFASELRSLFCHPGPSRTVDARGLYEFMSLTFVPSPRTAFERVCKLLPGHLLVCNRYGTRLERFHRSTPELLAETEDDLVERLRHEIVAAVARQMVADVPVGVMLSGGTDSATVATIMSQVAREPIQSFTVGFADDFSRNELEPARQTAERLGLSHHEVILSSDDFSGMLPKSVWHLEEPIATTSAFAFYNVCELARQHVKVVLTGQGADEPFAGYPRYLGERYGGVYRAVPPLLRRTIFMPLVQSLPRNEQLKRAVRSLGTKDEIERLARIYMVFDDGLRGELFVDDTFGEDGLKAAIARWHGDAANLDSLGKMLYIDARLSLADNLLLYADKMSMAMSLEARVPFLDLELMALAESIPAAFKIRGWKQKAILKRAMTDWLPQDVLRRKKVGFSTPVDEWFRGEMRSLVEERLLDRASACREYFRPDVIDRMIREHESGRHDHKRVLFSLLTFEIWHELFISPTHWSLNLEYPAAMGARRI